MGCLLGAFAGYFGGKVDTIIMRGTDILMSIPGLVLAISIATTLGPGLVNVMIAVGISSIPKFCRVVKGSTLTVIEQDYVEAPCNSQAVLDRWKIYFPMYWLPSLFKLSLVGVPHHGSPLSFLGFLSSLQPLNGETCFLPPEPKCAIISHGFVPRTGDHVTVLGPIVWNGCVTH